MIPLTHAEYETLLSITGFPLLSDNNELLFRGCHVAELTANLSDIQGRPEVKSYNGNILHMTPSYHRAYMYAKDNSRRNQFIDKRTCVVAYDQQRVSKFGRYIRDPLHDNTEEPVTSQLQLRWHANPNILNMADIQSAIEFIVYNCRVYNDHRSIPTDDVIVSTPAEDGCYIICASSQDVPRTCVSLTNNRCRAYTYQHEKELDLAVDTYRHRYLMIGGYIYRVVNHFKIYRTDHVGHDWMKEAGVHNFDHVLNTGPNGSYRKLIEPVYPVCI